MQRSLGELEPTFGADLRTPQERISDRLDVGEVTPEIRERDEQQFELNLLIADAEAGIRRRR